MTDICEKFRQARETRAEAFLRERERQRTRADIIAEMMARYKNERSLNEIDTPDLKGISESLKRAPDPGTLKEIEDIGQDIKKILEKK